MDKIKPLVIVLSRNYSTGLGVIRSLGAAGYPIDLIASTKKRGSSIIASSSKYVRHAEEVLSPKIHEDTGEELVEALMRYTKNNTREKIIIFPTDDFTASVVDSHRNQLEPFFTFPRTTNQAEFTVKELMDKTLQGKIARASGLLTPKEWTISLQNEIIIPEDMVYPCFVKPLQSVSGHKSEMTKCECKEQLQQHLLSMQSFYRDRIVLVQEFLDIEKEYDISGVCLDQEIILPAIIEKSRTAMYERGVAVSGTLYPAELFRDSIEKIKAMLRSLHYRGMFDIDLHFSQGKLYFSEINFRSGGLSFSYFLNGVNLPELYVKGVTGECISIEETQMESFEKTFVYEKVAWEEYIYNYITKKELITYIREADFTLLANEDDPKPGEVFHKRIQLSAIKQKIKRLLKTKKGTQSDKIVPKNNEIVVVGRNYANILTMTRGLGEAGYQSDILRVYKKKPNLLNLVARMKPDSYSKYVDVFSECIVEDNPGVIIETLICMHNGGPKKLLIPVDDYTAHIVDAHLEKLSPYYFIPNIEDTEGKICNLMDKSVQKQLAKAFHLPILHSTLVQSEDGCVYLPKDITYPCFVKPNVSMKNTKAMMTKCDNESELKKLLERFAQKENIEVLVEEFADIRAEYSILGLSTPNRTIAPGIFKTIDGGHRERKGVAITGQTINPDDFHDIIEACVQFVHALHYTGLFDIDLIETKDGHIYFVELNFRAGASMHVFTKTGVNLPGMLADYVLRGTQIKPGSTVGSIGKKFVSEKVLMEEYIRSDVDLKMVKRYMREADVHFVKDDLDSAPYRHFRLYYVAAMLMRIPYRIRDWKRTSR